MHNPNKIILYSFNTTFYKPALSSLEIMEQQSPTFTFNIDNFTCSHVLLIRTQQTAIVILRIQVSFIMSSSLAKIVMSFYHHGQVARKSSGRGKAARFSSMDGDWSKQ
jgi:hypothetical protein